MALLEKIRMWWRLHFRTVKIYTHLQELIADLRLSPRLDNFYEKIGVKTLGLLYPTVCRLQVPK